MQCQLFSSVKYYVNVMVLRMVHFVFRTMTAPVELIKCLKSIKQHAFSASEYPVVITLEDHLTADLQAKTAKVSF